MIAPTDAGSWDPTCTGSLGYMLIFTSDTPRMALSLQLEPRLALNAGLVVPPVTGVQTDVGPE
jgi:hypothetical protein